MTTDTPNKEGSDLTATLRSIAGSAEPTLDELAKRIKSSHEILVITARNLIVRAIEIGKDLLKAKAMQGHGNWGKWLEDNCALNDRTARRYMEIANGEATLAAKIKSDTMSELTLNEAKRLIDEEDEDDEAQAETETGEENSEGEDETETETEEGTGKGKKGKKGKNEEEKPKPHEIYKAKQEELIDALQDFTSVEHAEEWVQRTKERLDETLEAMKNPEEEGEEAEERKAA